ncbi:nicotinate (nicotinamide) nucleotide adenylyltransferase [candidate division KSB1 bacterium]|nr:MAG: nicotinate (nicotinamide) nucleotide adenylyltransferase [candidate division KSB1 bacterium]
MGRESFILRIAIYGGTFDPIHIAHLIIAEYAFAELSLDKLIFIPSFSPPHKLSVPMTSPNHRLHMVKLAIAENPKLNVSDFEIIKQGTSFTVDTLIHFSGHFHVQKKDLYLLVGADNLLDFHLWKDPEEIVRLAQIAVANRPSFTLSNARLTDYVVVGAPLLDISASMIRKRMQQKKSVRYLVPPKVEEYILQHGLYQ